ncbi:tetratricopeptide repeat protein [Spirulina major]|uniref:tetratricopeptide repeat protein n=1 Tax=Spirulina major TaxID=270636 RepID=UPI00093558A9|nr:tetratricopeptide repeat protein [Spirulina major]
MVKSWGLLGGMVVAGLVAGEGLAVAAPQQRLTLADFSQPIGLPLGSELPREWLMAQGAQGDEALRLYQEGRELFDQGTAESLRGAIEKLEAAIPLYQAANNPFGEALAQLVLGRAYDLLGFKSEALSSYEKSLAIWQELAQQTTGENLQTVQRWQATTLNNIGWVYDSLGEKSRALEYYNQALPLSRAVGDRSGEASTLNNIGLVYDSLGEKSRALEYYNQALPLSRAVGDRSGEASTLNNIGAVYDSLGEKSRALEYYNQALPLSRAVGDRSGEASTLNNIGLVYDSLGEKSRALEYYNQALPLRRAVGDRSGEATTLNNIGMVYDSLGEKSRALEYYNQALPLSRAVGDRSGEATTLNNIGLVYDSLGEKSRALEYYNQALPLLRAVGDRSSEANTLNNIGAVYSSLGEKSRAMEYYNQALPLWQVVGDRSGEASTLNNIGAVYDSLGEKSRALEYYNQALPLYQAVGDRGGEATSLVSIGAVYSSLGEKSRALEYFNQALPLRRAVGDRNGEADTLNNIGSVYLALGEKQQALDYFNQSLPLYRAVGDRRGEAGTLNNIGLVYSSIGEKSRALEYYNQALPLMQATGSRENLSITLNNIGRIFADQNQPEVAIIFLKESVRIRETIRTDNHQLDEQLRQSYVTTIEHTYRFLADLLLTQARIPEAQQVLDLLKLQELRDFTNTRATFTSNGEIRYTDPEQAVLNDHNSLIALGTTILTCQDQNCNEIDRLHAQRESLKRQYNAQVAEFTATIRANRANDEEFQDPERLSGDANKLLRAYNQAGQNTVLIYPFVLEDKLWLVWAAAGGVIGSIEIPVTQAEIAQTVQRLGQELTRDSSLSRLQSTSQQLYDWIIQPLERELEANDIDHLVFVNDRVTRYIPMGALFDGEQYLLEKYTISSVLAPSLTDTDSTFNHSDSRILGMGLTEAIRGFNPLPAVQDELEGIISQGNNPGVYPGQVLLNQDFTFNSLKTNVFRHNVLHLATHAVFVPGRANESYILLGDGNALRADDINAIEDLLENLQLVILSACQTALGGEAGDGTEIAGISSYFLRTNRAKTVIASLWSVNDRSTSVLMQRFYTLLATGELSQAEALRQAQLSLLYREETADFETRVADSRSLISVRPRNGAVATAPGFSHPYHWSPFILIGNGL